MTLHEAIRKVLLRRTDLTASTSEISELIAVEDLYTRKKDGAFAKASQINARARKYPGWFEFVAPGVVRLVGSR